MSEPRFEVGLGESVYACELCGGTYRRKNNSSMCCTVNHGQFNCCHFNEEMLSPRTFRIGQIPLTPTPQGGMKG